MPNSWTYSEFPYIFSDNMRTVTGLGFSKQSIDSKTFLGGKETLDSYRLFGNLEYRYDELLFNLGAMAEYEPDLLDKPAYSPRLGVNYKFDDNSTVRFILSKSVRTPDFLEERMNWNYHLTNLTPAYPTNNATEATFYFNAKGNENLKPEEITAREISFYTKNSINLGQGKSLSYNYDVKFFYNTLDNLISEKPTFFDFNLTNNSSATLKGMETDINFNLDNMFYTEMIDDIDFHINYSYIENDTNEPNEKVLNARHIGSAYTIVNFQNDSFASLAYRGNSKMAGESFDAWEFGGGKTFNRKNSSLTLKGKVVYLPDNEDNFSDNSTQTSFNINDKHTYFYLTLAYSIK